MITPMQMYWLTRLDGIKCVFTFPAFIIVAVIVVMDIIAFAGFMAEFELEGFHEAILKFKNRLRTILICTITALLLFFISSLIPTTKEMAAILIVPKIANSEKVQDTGNKLYELAVEWVDALNPKKNGVK